MIFHSRIIFKISSVFISMTSLFHRKYSPRGVLWKRFLKDFAKFIGKKHVSEFLLNKSADIQSLTLLKNKFRHRFFQKSLRTYFFRTPPDDCFCSNEDNFKTITKNHKNAYWQIVFEKISLEVALKGPCPRNT